MSKMISSDSQRVVVDVSSTATSVAVGSTQAVDPHQLAFMPKVGLSMPSTASSVMLSLNPKALEQAEKTARANLAIELGHLPVLRSTR